MSKLRDAYTVRIHREPGESHIWAEVDELPGCFATGRDDDELRDALAEAISLYLSEPGHEVRIELEAAEGSITEQQVLARTA